MLVRLYWQMTLTHLLCSLTAIVPKFMKQEKFKFDKVLQLIATCFTIFNFIQICHFFFVAEDNASERTQEYNEFRVWLLVELIVFISGIAAHMLFLLMRSLSKQKV
jgi:purine-cytosine permease-like protein